VRADVVAARGPRVDMNAQPVTAGLGVSVSVHDNRVRVESGEGLRRKEIDGKTPAIVGTTRRAP
jgi:hypothetical protein